MSNKIDRPELDPELRARIRQHITLLLMIVPAICALPPLLFVAPAGPIQLIFGAILLTTLGLALFIGWRLLRLLQGSR